MVIVEALQLAGLDKLGRLSWHGVTDPRLAGVRAVGAASLGFHSQMYVNSQSAGGKVLRRERQCVNNLSERLSYFHITAYSVMQPVFFIALITKCTWFLLFSVHRAP